MQNVPKRFRGDYEPKGRGFESLQPYQKKPSVCKAFRPLTLGSFYVRGHESGTLVGLREFRGTDAGRGLFLPPVDEAVQRLACLLVALGEGVGVDVQRGAHLCVAQPFQDGQDVHPLRDQQAGLCVPLWHNKDKSENP